jgi:hypothetical protein
MAASEAWAMHRMLATEGEVASMGLWNGYVDGAVAFFFMCVLPVQYVNRALQLGMSQEQQRRLIRRLLNHVLPPA